MFRVLIQDLNSVFVSVSVCNCVTVYVCVCFAGDESR